MHPVSIVGIASSPKGPYPLLVLRSEHDQKLLLIAIGEREAQAMVAAITGGKSERPLSHELQHAIHTVFELQCTQACIHDIREGVFYGTITLQGDGPPLAFDARPSDAITIAIYHQAPILIEDQVMSKEGLRGTTQSLGLRMLFELSETVLQDFRAFLTTFHPDDFSTDDLDHHP